MTRLALPQVTLCCVDCTARLPWALKALQHCLDQVDFGDALLFTDRGSLDGRSVPEGLRWVEIDALESIEAYSTFMLKGLAEHLHTTHMLVVQWDGYVLNPSAWRDEFLGFDYIGAPWNHIPEPWAVGNGGFSLRSLKLLQALQDSVIVPGHPEDLCICKTYRGMLEAKAIRFAPLALARQFAVEEGPMGPEVFGFHGPYHLPTVLSPSEMLALVESLEPSAIQGHYFGQLLRQLRLGMRANAALKPAFAAFEQLIWRAVDTLEGASSLTPRATGICKELVRHGQFAAARRLLDQRRSARGSAGPDARLRLRLNLKWLAHRLSGG